MSDSEHSKLQKELARCPLFEDADLRSIAAALSGCRRRKLATEETLIAAGQPNDCLYILLSGRLTAHFKDTRLGSVDIFEPGQLVGLLSFMDAHPSSAHEVATEASRVLVLSSETVWSLVDRFPTVARNLLVLLTHRLRHGPSLVEAALLEKVAQRNAGNASNSSVEIPVAQGGMDERAVRLYQTLVSCAEETIEGARAGRAPDLKRASELGKQILTSLAESQQLVFLSTDRRQEFAIRFHSANVAVLAGRIAETLQVEARDRIRLSAAALVHEIGVIELPEAMIYREELHPETRQRSIYAGRLLRELCPAERWLIQMVEQVFERGDGSGPLGMEGKQISDEVQILGIADVFDAAIHNRPYRKAITGYQLIHELTRTGTKAFSDRIVKALVHTFSLYPYNEYVLLNSNEVGQVIQVHADNPLRPVIRLLYDSQGTPLQEFKQLDLAEQPSRFIARAISYDRLPALVAQLHEAQERGA